ncbi:MAG TPA: DUF2793 domain-containing protein [Sphingomonas sp.]
MSDTTPRLALPLLAPGQAQKEMFHNEALARIDAALHAVAQALGDDDPPAAPVSGQCWITGGAPTGAWAGQAGVLAAWTDGGWRFVAPMPGMIAWLAGAGVYARFDGAAWRIGELVADTLVIGGQQVVAARQPAIAAPAAGTTVDTESRAALTAILMALRTHGLIET